MPAAPTLTVIGLDAATFDVIDPLLAEGQLPAIAALLERGSRGVLRSTTHPLTPTAWSTMVTGVGAGRHGMWDFSARDESGYRLYPVNGSYRRAPAVWDLLTQAGRRTGVVNVPFTWPAPSVDGFSLAGLDASARDDGMAFPDGLLAELRSRFGQLELDHRFPLGDDGVVDLDQVRRAAEQKVALTLWLAERFEPELLWVVFMAADHIHHLCWPEWELEGSASRVAEVYRILDEAVGALVEHAAGHDVMLVSDHGGGALDGVVNLNAWLAREGFLEYVGAQGGIARADLGRRAFAQAFALRRRLPKGLRRAVKQRVPGLRERAYELRSYSAIDWSRTRAFAYGTFGNIVLNVRGREAQGIVEPGAEYERVCDEITDQALDLRGHDGERIVAAVHRREQLFAGPYLDRVPDLVVEFAEYRYLGKGNMAERSDSIWDRIAITPGSKEDYVGSHRHEGIVALAGPSAVQGGELFASIEDVAPTVLYLLDEPIPSDLEGRVLAEAIEPALLDQREPAYTGASQLEVAPATSYGEEGDEVSERLRGLGYLE
jgi:predicted AlkP superfamily phosphohydrolase/phosphomutase